MTPRPHAASYWHGTSRHAVPVDPLAEDIEADVTVVGAGFTGLSAAHHLHAAGRTCVVLEANEVGWGASGRNGGIAVPRYKLTFPELERAYGLDTAMRMYRLAHDALDRLEQIVRRRRLDCGFGRYGHLTPLYAEMDAARFRADVDWLARHADDRAPAVLDREATAARLGTGFYAAAYFEPRGGGLHPLEYCQALALSLRADGVRVHAASPVDEWTVDADGVTLRANGRRVRARQLLVATNGYTDLTPAGDPLKRRVVPVASALIGTVPLPADVRASLLPKGNLATDAKRLTNYYRLMPDGRFVFGGRGGASSEPKPGAYDRLAQDMVDIFPQLAGASLEYRWFGLVAATLDFLPRVGRLRERVSYAMGYNGRGVALSALLGAKLAELALGGEVKGMGPISDGAFAPIPFHALRVPAKQAAITWMLLRDTLGAALSGRPRRR